ncbi:hypothetical protein KY346_00660 [Candidatus Woesearchaeota archaeon]|nr:hypothetical protein [Candidatus Woesearchaeota archaeon]
MDESEKLKNFSRISDDIALALFTREHYLNGTYERRYSGPDKCPETVINSKCGNLDLQLEFDQETYQKGRFSFSANLPAKCEYMQRSEITTQLSQQFKDTQFGLDADETNIELVGPFDDSNIEEVKSAILSVDDAVRALYQE